MFIKTDMPVVDATTLKTARQARGLTSSDIARETRLSPRTITAAGPWMVGVEILPRAHGPMALNLFLRRGVAYVAREIELMFVSASQPDEG